MNTRRAIGIDIGGTKISLAVVNDTGQIEAQTRLPTEAQRGFQDGIRRMAAAIHDLTRQVGLPTRTLVGIGIGCPGPLDPFTGVITTDYNLPSWGGCNILHAFRDLFGVPVRLENDADAALVGEAHAGAGRDARAIVMLTFGTGVGGAALNDGHIYRGANGEHPEIGHIPIDPTGPECYCGLYGCLESLASGTAIADAGRSSGFADSQDVFAQAASANPTASLIVDRAIHASASALWTLIHTFLPERVILGGGIMEEHYALFEPAMNEVITRSKLGPSKGMQLRKAQLLSKAGLVGAAFLALRP